MCMLSNSDISGLRSENMPVVDSQIPELNPLHDSGLVEARNNRRIVASSVERDIVKENILHPEAGAWIIFRIKEYADVD